MMFMKKSFSRMIIAALAALSLTTAGGAAVSAAALPETPYYFDAAYICEGTYGASNTPAHEYWRHSVAELTEEDDVPCLKMVAATNDTYPTQVNIYWSDKGSGEDAGAINVETYPYVLMRYKTTRSASVDLTAYWNVTYFNDVGTVEAGGWNETILKFDPSKINKGSFNKLTDNMYIRFWGETPSKEYVGAEFYLEYVAFFKTEEDALAFAAARNAVNAEPEITENAPQTADGIALAAAALFVSAGGVYVFRRRRTV
ncbi:MAG: hypothetical protein IJ493_10135 [Clostridia bacterium]|nr:hypothetical protein [Clostridia bacterium]